MWVRNGWVAVAWEKTKEQPYKNLAWGSGWGHTREEAEYNARRVCRGFAQENCVLDGGGARRTPVYDPNGSTTGGAW